MSPETARPAAGASRAGLDDFRVAAESRFSLHPIALRAQAQRRLRRQRQVEWICRTPRLVAELIDEIARHHGIEDDITRRLAAYAALDPALLVSVGGDRFPASPVRIVGGAP